MRRVVIRLAPAPGGWTVETPSSASPLFFLDCAAARSAAARMAAALRASGRAVEIEIVPTTEV